MQIDTEKSFLSSWYIRIAFIILFLLFVCFHFISTILTYGKYRLYFQIVQQTSA